jgi:hypothetical protein
METDDQYYSNLITNMILQGYTPQESVMIRTGLTEDELLLYARTNDIKPLVLYPQKTPNAKIKFWRLDSFPTAPKQNSIAAFGVEWRKFGEFSDFKVFESKNEPDRFFMIDFEKDGNAIAFSRDEAEFISLALLQLLQR